MAGGVGSLDRGLGAGSLRRVATTSEHREGWSGRRHGQVPSRIYSAVSCREVAWSCQMKAKEMTRCHASEVRVLIRCAWFPQII